MRYAVCPHMQCKKHYALTAIDELAEELLAPLSFSFILKEN